MSKAPTKNKDEIRQQLPIIRANKDHIEAIFGLFAAVSEFEKAYTIMPARFAAIPHGKRNIKMMMAVLDDLVQDLCCTLPTEKLVSIKRMLPHMRYKVHFGATVSQIGKDECIIQSPDLDILARNAHEQCKLCIDQNCRKCKLGKVFDRVYTHDRGDDGSWAYVSFEEEMS